MLIGPRSNNRQVTQYLHRLVCIAFHGPPPTPDHEAAHEDGNRENNTADNLSWKTSMENKSDMVRHGTRRSGSKHPMAKLNESLVRKIFDLRANGLTLRQISPLVGGIHLSIVSDVLHRKLWREVAL